MEKFLQPQYLLFCIKFPILMPIVLCSTITNGNNIRILVCLNKKRKNTPCLFDENALDKWEDECYNKVVTLLLQPWMKACIIYWFYLCGKSNDGRW